MNLNKVYLIGRLTQDPEVRATPSGQSVTTLRLATNRVWNDPSSGQRKEATEYHTAIAWRRIGEIANQYLKKGSLAMIEGRLQTRSWTGQDNVKRFRTEIIVEGLQLGPKSAGGQSEAPGSRPDSKKDKDEKAKEEIPIIDEDEPISHGVDEEEMKIKEKDLPF